MATRKVTELRRASSPAAGVPVFVARQPIYDRDLNVRAYELLSRPAGQTAFDGSDGTRATARLLVEGLLAQGLQVLTAGKLAYVNCTRDVILGGYAELLPPQDVAVEVLEEVPAAREVLEACARLRTAGYRVSLDDVASLDRAKKFAGVLDVVKLDVRDTPPDMLPSLVRGVRAALPGIELVAEKVETHEELGAMRALGFDSFQGFFLSRPTLLERRAVPGFKPHYMQLLEAVGRPELDLRDLESLIKTDLSLTHKLIRQANSAAAAQARRISSLREALVLLGANEVRRVAALIVLAGLGADRPQQLAIDSAVRARFCEGIRLPEAHRVPSFERFLGGMFSMLDAILGVPMEEAVGTLPLPDDVTRALVAREGPLGQLLSLAESYGRGEWDEASAHATALAIEDATLPARYLEAVGWSREVFDLGDLAA
ncbi:MAG: HDOD domain-containing protein [Dehalococcoidia bacterium]|nr:HDOD domain-containing protein [Dehalococcoidia bacterium]